MFTSRQTTHTRRGLVHKEQIAECKLLCDHALVSILNHIETREKEQDAILLEFFFKNRNGGITDDEVNQRMGEHAKQKAILKEHGDNMKRYIAQYKALIISDPNAVSDLLDIEFTHAGSRTTIKKVGTGAKKKSSNVQKNVKASYAVFMTLTNVLKKGVNELVRLIFNLIASDGIKGVRKVFNMSPVSIVGNKIQEYASKVPGPFGGFVNGLFCTGINIAQRWAMFKTYDQMAHFTREKAYHGTIHDPDVYVRGQSFIGRFVDEEYTRLWAQVYVTVMLATDIYATNLDLFGGQVYYQFRSIAGGVMEQVIKAYDNNETTSAMAVQLLRQLNEKKRKFREESTYAAVSEMLTGETLELLSSQTFNLLINQTYAWKELQYLAPNPGKFVMETGRLFFYTTTGFANVSKRCDIDGYGVTATRISSNLILGSFMPFYNSLFSGISDISQAVGEGVGKVAVAVKGGFVAATDTFNKGKNYFHDFISKKLHEELPGGPAEVGGPTDSIAIVPPPTPSLAGRFGKWLGLGSGRVHKNDWIEFISTHKHTLPKSLQTTDTLYALSFLYKPFKIVKDKTRYDKLMKNKRFKYMFEKRKGLL